MKKKKVKRCWKCGRKLKRVKLGMGGVMWIHGEIGRRKCPLLNRKEKLRIVRGSKI